MDFLTSLGILGETISRNQSYTDIGAIREELKKLNSATQNNAQNKSNSSSEEFEELTYILRKMAEAQGIKLESKEELRQRKKEEERIKREEEKREIDRLVAERRAKREREKKEQIDNCPNYSELYNESDYTFGYGIGIFIGFVLVGLFIFMLVELGLPILQNNMKYEQPIAKEEITIPVDSSVYKRTNPNNEVNFAASNKKLKEKNKKKDNYYNDKIVENEEIEEEIENNIDENKIFDVVEEMPQFPGGSAALFEYLNKNIRYPIVAQENGVQGRVVTTFVVECDGSISDVKVVKSVDPSLDIEAKRIVRSMPSWIPAKQNGKRVRAKYTVPVTFRLYET